MSGFKTIDDGLFEVVVPQGVRPGQSFAVIVNGQRVMVTCPLHAQPGQKIKFYLPIQMSDQQISLCHRQRAARHGAPKPPAGGGHGSLAKRVATTGVTVNECMLTSFKPPNTDDVCALHPRYSSLLLSIHPPQGGALAHHTSVPFWTSAVGATAGGILGGLPGAMVGAAALSFVVAGALLQPPVTSN